MNPNSSVTVENVSHAFDGHVVVDQVSFGVAQGQFFILIGPNGSGKTTLLKLVAGLLRLKAGQIEILHRAVDRYAPRALARCLAYVPQSVPMEFPFSVTQVVLMGRAPHLGLLAFEGEADLDLAHQISGGERQRVFIARAICQQPRIMLLDEPTAALDLAQQVRIMDLLERLKADQGVSVVMVSHDLNLAAMYADQVLLLDNGRVASLGPPGAVLDYAVLEKVYGARVLVDRSPLGDYPRVHLVPGRYLDPSLSKKEPRA
jgi:iron complex transport system ATP-binding protein